MGLHQTKKTFAQKRKPSTKMKKAPNEWGNILANDTSDKGLTSKIYKNLYNSTPEKHKQSN